jgi:hypothetical protein
MATTLEFSFDFPYPADEVFQQGIQKDYIEAKAPALDHYDAELLDLRDGPEGGGATMRYTIEADLPSWAKKMFPERNTVTETHSWPGRAADGGRSYAFTVRIANVPADIKGSVMIVPTGATSCRSQARVDIKASLPIVGGKLEELVARDLSRTVEGEAAFIRQWLDGKQSA